MPNRRSTTLLIAIFLCTAIMPALSARKLYGERQTVPAPDIDTMSWFLESQPTIYELAIDREDFDSIISNPGRKALIHPAAFLGEPVFDNYMMLDSLSIFDRTEQPDSAFADSYRWLNDLNFDGLLLNTTMQNYMIQHPERIRYNMATLPRPPKQYRAFVNPLNSRIEFEEQKIVAEPLKAEIDEKHWLGKFNASLQFSQAYISPNWYQGGNNNLNMLALLAYNLKLNQQYHPRYLFDMTIQYKLGLNSTPDDSIRAYSISEDLFQFNLTTGLKAARNWFYSGTVNFKTQIFNSYPLNSRDMKASFMSPGELNIGLGMTYNRTNAKKNFNLALSISPLSWNFKTCLNEKVDETSYGIKAGHKTASEIGSSVECNIKWQLTYNIVYTSRLFAFSDYSYLQSDWEHTIDFAINKYLSTRFYLHLRYDTSTPRVDDSKWHKLQMKEILSFGINYTFGTV